MKQAVGGKRGDETNHDQCPDGVVKKDDGRSHEHGEADEFVKLRRDKMLARDIQSMSFWEKECLVPSLKSHDKW